MNTEISFYGRTAVFWTDGHLPSDTKELVESDLMKYIIHKFLAQLNKYDSPLLSILPQGLSEQKQEKQLCEVFKLLNETQICEIRKQKPEMSIILSNTHRLHQFIEEFYNYWRNFERYLVCTSNPSKNYDKTPYRAFNDTVEHMNHMFRKLYRDICENITGDHPWIYRQLAAGFQVGVIAVERDWPCPKDYSNIKDIHIIRQALLYPPMIIDPLMNKRTGEFKRVDENPLFGVRFESGEWLCYPAKVGELVIHVYFHDKYIGLGCALSNLFEIASEKDLDRKPDAIYAFGMPEGSLDRFGDLPAVFYDDEKNGVMVGAVPCDDRFGYFGYLKKMILTLHNVVMMKRGRMPVHGAMVSIMTKNSKTANIMIMGDTGAGKSESLEAFRTLGDRYVKRMTIIFDDMGSLEIDGNYIKAYGTEIGAFVRLDDLQAGFAFGNLDRSIIMSPQKVNARAVIPVTTIHDVLKGHKVDYVLYANNYENIDDNHKILSRFDNADDAVKVFRDGAVMSKGTTTSTGLVHTYFANVFGPSQYKGLHDNIAGEFFTKFFDENIFVGELRTRLGIHGFESEGPREAAKALLSLISEET